MHDIKIRKMFRREQVNIIASKVYSLPRPVDD